MINIFREAGAVYRLLRRWYYFTFRRDYIVKQFQQRKGICGQHGCCDLSSLAKHRTCIDPNDRTKCLKWEQLPFGCKMYPFDEKDKIPETRAYCNFHWDE